MLDNMEPRNKAEKPGGKRYQLASAEEGAESVDKTSHNLERKRIIQTLSKKLKT